MISDNGSTFIANETRRFAVDRSIYWKFNVAKAPWTGGFFERLIACVKNCIKKTIGCALLRFDELLTVVSEVELTINSRPIVALYDDIVEDAISPNHLLFGRKLDICNTESDEIPETNPSKRMKYIQIVLSHYWKRWSTEYLTSLREYQKSRSIKKTLRVPHVNDIVIIKIEKLPRQKWPLGRVTELVPSRDGSVRAVKVLVGKTGSTLERPVNLLYPLEFDVEISDAMPTGSPKAVRDNIDSTSDLENGQPEASVMEMNENRDSSTPNPRVRIRREAAVLGEIRRKFGRQTVQELITSR